MEMGQDIDGNILERFFVCRVGFKRFLILYENSSSHIVECRLLIMQFKKKLTSSHNMLEFE